MQILEFILTVYLIPGLLFAGWFWWRGSVQLDEKTQGAGWGVRLLWFPGLIVLWPVLALRFRIPASLGGPYRAPERHLVIWSGLSILLPVGFIVAILALPGKTIETAWRSPLPAALPIIVRHVENDLFLVNIRKDSAQTRQLEIFVKKNLEAPAVEIRNGQQHIGIISGHGLFRFPIDTAIETNIRIIDPIHQQTLATF